jgi:hypothetical protein
MHISQAYYIIYAAAYKHFWTDLVVLYPLEQEGGVVVLCGQILSSKVWHSLDLWCFQDNWEL